MLALVDIPEELDLIHKKCQSLSSELVSQIHTGKSYKLAGETDLLDCKFPAYVYVQEGLFKLFINNKMIRFYSNGDLLFTDKLDFLKNCKIVSEFGSEITLFERGAFFEAIQNETQLYKKFLEIKDLENYMMAYLSSIYISENKRPNIKLKQFLEGQTIIQEGQSPDEIFEMITGKALASSKGVDLGIIGPKEVFGEISFLTGQPRSATVVAKSNCTLQVISQSDFFFLIKTRPQLIINISKTLAKRVLDLNKRIVGA